MLLPCGSPAPVWSRSPLPACTCSSSVSCSWSSPPCPYLSTERGDVRWGLRQRGKAWWRDIRLQWETSFCWAMSHELWQGQIQWEKAEWLAVLTKKHKHKQKILTGKGKMHNTLNSYICNQLSRFQAHWTLWKIWTKMFFLIGWIINSTFYWFLLIIQWAKYEPSNTACAPRLDTFCMRL